MLWVARSGLAQDEENRAVEPVEYKRLNIDIGTFAYFQHLLRQGGTKKTLSCKYSILLRLMWGLPVTAAWPAEAGWEWYGWPPRRL